MSERAYDAPIHETTTRKENTREDAIYGENNNAKIHENIMKIQTEKSNLYDHAYDNDWRCLVFVIFLKS